MTKIGAIDSLTKDCVIQLSECQKAVDFLALPQVIARLAKNDKTILTEGEYNEFSANIANCISEEHIGGSAFNTCATIAAAMGEAEVSFITPPSANKNVLAPINNLNFTPADPKNTASIISRVSYICLDTGGHKRVLKYLGNINEYLHNHPGYLAELKNSISEVIATADLFFLPGGITKKFPYEIFSHVLREIEKNSAKLIFALPTHSDFSKEELILYKSALTQAKIILGNADELKNTLGEITSLEKYAATSFITDGANDAYLIVDSKTTRIKPLSLPANIASFTGAGDSAFAGFIIGLLQGKTPQISAETAMIFAHEVLKTPASRLPDPQKLLRK